MNNNVLKIVVFTKESTFQNFLINHLNETNPIAHVIIESGSSFMAEKKYEKNIIQKIVAKVLLLLSNPKKFYYNIMLIKNFKKWYGNEVFHEQRILKENYQNINSNISSTRVHSVNDPKVIELLKTLKPELVFVFGTGIIKENVFKAIDVPFVNLHWGWCPDYRSEGIITALAFGGPAHLGATVHLLSKEVDGGDILYQERPSVDRFDNFYSIGLKLSRLGLGMFLRVIGDLPPIVVPPGVRLKPIYWT